MTKSEQMMIRDLQVHPVAQRRLIYSRVAELKKKMKPYGLGTFDVVCYPIAVDGKTSNGPWIVNGQTRYYACVELHMGEWVVDVKIHSWVHTDPEAHELFLLLNNSRPVRTYDRYRNELLALYPWAVAVEQIIRKRGFRTSSTVGDGNIVCVQSLQSVYEIDEDGSLLDDTLGLIVEAWGATTAAVEGRLVRGLAEVMHHYGAEVDRGTLLKKLSKYPGGASAIIGDARGLSHLRHGNVMKSVVEVIVNLYNSGRRNRLDPL
jgi:hypothetical protein